MRVQRYTVEVVEVVERKVRYEVDATDIEHATELALDGEGFNEVELDSDVTDSTLVRAYREV